MSKATKTFKIIPLGGFEEFGKNCLFIETTNDILIIDCGLKFSSVTNYGIDFTINDFSYLIQKASKKISLLITHGHLDHIGGIPFLLQQLSVPIFCTAFTAKLIFDICSQYAISPNITLIEPLKLFQLGDFFCTPVYVNHSIIDSVAFHIKIYNKHLVFSGDYKIDSKPLFESSIDLKTFKTLGKQGVFMLFGDSTNAASNGNSLSESNIIENIQNIFIQANGRIIITTFASQINRVKLILQIAVILKKKVVLLGRSLVKNIEYSQELDVIEKNTDIFIPFSSIKNYEDNKLIIITTGTQGEEAAGITKLANKTHPKISIKDTDTILFSSSVIPGNEQLVHSVINKLKKTKVSVYTNNDLSIHATGHAQKEEIKYFLSLLKPKYYLPVHGDISMMIANKNIAIRNNIPPNQCMLLENGSILEVKENSVYISQKLNLSDVLIENKKNNYLTNNVISERKLLSAHGVCTIHIVHLSGHMKNISILDYGISEVKSMEPVKKNIINYINNHINNKTAGHNNNQKISCEKLVKEITKTTKKIILSSLGKTPHIQVVIDL